MLKEGDKNTSFFFHEKASRRKARNIVSRIKDEHGCWCEKEGDIELVFVSYFEQIFQTQDNIDAELVTSLVRPSMTSELNPMLTKRIAGEEVYAAHQQMHPTKAPGPDEGLSVLIGDREERKLIHGIKVSYTAPTISHFFFADDNLLFVRATQEEADQVLQLLQDYELASG